MNPRTWLLGAAVLLCSCDAAPCRQMCKNGGREQLIRDFGVRSEAVNCDDEKWAIPQTCEECGAMLQKDYGVVLTGCDTPVYIQPASP